MVALKHLRAGEPESGPAADAGALLADDHRAVIETLKRLPRRQREVLILRYWLDLSESEIATTLGIACGTVKSTASRALHAMEHLLEEGGNDD
jgi:RNA polymerase sigma factor (sigma-70 family)